MGILIDVLALLTSKSGLAACLSVMATIATERLTRIAYASVSPKNSRNACKCRTPNIPPAARARTHNKWKREKNRQNEWMNGAENSFERLSVKFLINIQRVIKWTQNCKLNVKYAKLDVKKSFAHNTILIFIIFPPIHFLFNVCL